MSANNANNSGETRSGDMNPTRRPSGERMAILVGLACLLLLPATSHAQQTGSQTITTGLPIGPSPDARNRTLSIDVTFPLPGGNGALMTVTIPVSDVPVTAGLPFPTPAQAAAASAAKAAAIAKAINDANLPGVMATVPATTVPQPYISGYMNRVVGRAIVRVPIYSNANMSQFTVSGVAQPTNLLTGMMQPAVRRTPGNNVTGELGDGYQPFLPATGGGGSMGGSMGMSFQGSYNGSGATNTATGMDVAGNQSVVEFGFIDNTGASPVDYIEGVAPTSGMTDADILGTLADEFNADYTPDGYTATYDSSDDSLSINQSLPPPDELYFGDSDTGTVFDADMESLPEPASATLGSVALVGLLARRRRE